MYYHTIDRLAKAGYRHYEISNFAKTGFECRHNLNYWDRGQYLGIGAGAHSFIGEQKNRERERYRQVYRVIKERRTCR